MLAYTESQRIFVPEHRIQTVFAHHKYMPLRGFGYIMAVFQGDECVGWIECDTLGFKTAADWLKNEKTKGTL